MIKEFFKFLTNFDWVSPAVAIAQDVDNGAPFNMDVWTFFIPWAEAEAAGWSEYTIRQALDKYNINVWGGLLYGDEYMFKVDLWQARLTEWVLAERGIPLAERCQGAPDKAKKIKVKYRKW